MSLACGLCQGHLGQSPKREGGYDHRLMVNPQARVYGIFGESNAPYLVTPCGHLFHSECLKEWTWINLEPEKRQFARIAVQWNEHFCADCREPFKWSNLRPCFPAFIRDGESQACRGTLEAQPEAEDCQNSEDFEVRAPEVIPKKLESSVRNCINFLEPFYNHDAPGSSETLQEVPSIFTYGPYLFGLLLPIILLVFWGLMALACGICLGKLVVAPESEGYQYLRARRARYGIFSDGDTAPYLITPCGHQFHSECIKEWVWIKMRPVDRLLPSNRVLMIPNECPFCRSKFFWANVRSCYPSISALEDFQSTEGTQTLEFQPDVKDGATQTMIHTAIKSTWTQTQSEAKDEACQTGIHPAIKSKWTQTIMEFNEVNEIGTQTDTISVKVDSKVDLELRAMKMAFKKMEVKVKCTNLILDALFTQDPPYQINIVKTNPTTSCHQCQHATSVFFDGSFSNLLIGIFIFVFGMAFNAIMF